MDADKQDWFLKQQELVFDSARRLPGITFVEPVQTREAKISSVSLSSSSTTDSLGTDDLDEDEKFEHGISKDESISNLLSIYEAPPPPPDEDVPDTPDNVVTEVESKPWISKVLKTLLTRGQEVEIEQLTRYVARLRQMISVKETRILQLHRKMKSVKQKSKQEVDKYSKWAADQLANIARSYRENQILWLNTQLEIEVYYVRIWTKLAELIELYIAKKDKETHAQIVKIIYRQDGDKVITIEPTDIELPEKYKILKNSVVQMEAVLSALRADFREHRKAEHAKTAKMHDRAQKIRFLLRKGAIDSLKDSFEGAYFHRIEKVPQNEFNRLMIDQRHVEGIALEGWTKLLNENISTGSISSEAVGKGIFGFMKSIVVENELPPNDNLLKPDPMALGDIDETSSMISGSLSTAGGSEIAKHLSDPASSSNVSSDDALLVASAFEAGTVVTVWSVLKVYVDRLIYPRLSHIFSYFTDPEDVKRDQIFVQKCRWLNRLSQEDFKIHKQLCYKGTTEASGTGTLTARSQPAVLAYGRAIKHLSRLEVECESVPINVLGHCVKFGKLIEDDAKLYITDKKFVYSADDLIPVVEWCIVHSKLNHLHELIAHTHRFLGNDASTGQGGYYLSSIEGKLHLFEMIRLTVCCYLVALNALMNHFPAEFGLSDEVVESMIRSDVSRASVSIVRDETKSVV
jgi:hypothetical protein